MFQFCPRIVALLVLIGVVAVDGRNALADDFVIDISSPKRSKYPIALPMGTGDQGLAKEISKVATFDMQVAGWFRVLDQRSFLANQSSDAIDIDAWKNVGAFGVVKTQATRQGNRIALEFKLYEIEKGANPVLSRRYSGTPMDVRKLTHSFYNEVVKHFTGESGFFGSRIAFSMRNGKSSKKIMSVDFDGANLATVTKNASINIMPAYSPNGARIAYTSYLNKNPDLYVASADGRGARAISTQKGMNTSASWSPDGTKIALTLSKDGNSEIYVVQATTGKVLRRLTDHRAIDTSPAWSPRGDEIAFISDREGGPQIFVMNADGTNPRRVSMNGSYNTTPTWSPRLDERKIAYTTRDEKTFDIVTLNLDTKEMVRITQREGVNEEPSFSPNGRAIAFTSFRKGGQGIYLAPADGKGNAIRVWRGKAYSLDWGRTIP